MRCLTCLRSCKKRYVIVSRNLVSKVSGENPRSSFLHAGPVSTLTLRLRLTASDNSLSQCSGERPNRHNNPALKVSFHCLSVESFVIHHRAAPHLITYVHISNCCEIGYLYCYIIRKCNLNQALLQGFSTHEVTIGRRSVTRPEPLFVILLRSPGIDSQPGGWNRFLGS
jgi:hypothetical protein